MMQCQYIAEWPCLVWIANAEQVSPTVEECRFCLEARTRWISSLKHIENDYHANLQELNTLREEKKKWEEMPR